MKEPKKNPLEQKEMNFISESDIFSNNSDIVIYDIDKVDKIYKDIIEANEKIQQILKQTSISGNPLEVENQGLTNIFFKNNIKYNRKKNILTINDKESYKGKLKDINQEKKFYCLDKGIYKLNENESYEGSFNENNFFEGKGILKKEGVQEKYTFESIFSNGYPKKNGIFKLTSNDCVLYIESNIIKNDNQDSRFKLILNGRTNITKKEGNKEIYRFDGEIINGKINGYAIIKKEYKKLRNIEINLSFTRNEKFKDVQNLEMEINDKYKTIDYNAKYVNGLKYGKFSLQDKQENINVENKRSELKKVLKQLYKRLLKTYGAEYFEKLYRFNLPHLKLFNRVYKTNIKDSDKLVHLIKKNINLYALTFFCKIYLTDLKELSLNDCQITDLSPLENANFPQLIKLSLGRNNIVSIASINKLPFPLLQNLMLGYNQINDLSPLNTYKSEHLKVLFLLGNAISDISSFENISTPNLEEISLGSQIKDISLLAKFNFPKLRQLALTGNKIKNISPLINFTFPELDVLYLGNNEIVNLNPLKKCNFPKLRNLGLDNNRIKDINPLFNLKLPKLNYLNLSHNKFRPNSSEIRESIASLKKKIERIIV